MTRLAIVGALHGQIAALRPGLADARTGRRAGRDFQRFVRDVAAPSSRELVRETLRRA
jgi:hypothetical protein